LLRNIPRAQPDEGRRGPLMPSSAIVLELDAEQAERLSDALLEAGAASVELEDADAATSRERAAYGEPGEPAARASWQRTRVQVLLDSSVDAKQILERAALAAGLAASPPYSQRLVADQDWVRATQSQFPPVSVGERLWIVPSWHEPPGGDAVVVRIDPGRAFGTGTHPTTRLMLEWLERELKPAVQPANRRQMRVLDYGCGSGILAIAAAKLGAVLVDAVDIDRDALEVCRANALDNAVELRTWHSSEPLDGRYDRVVANILAGPLIELAALLAERLADGGRIALSGILEDQAQEVERSCAASLALHVAARSEGWVLLEGERRKGERR
jgi:ribosomal protein L11 methyltransferase